MPVYKYCLKLTLNREDAADITQETMARAVEKIKLYDENKASFCTWLITIAKNTWLTAIKRKKRFESYCSRLAVPEDYDNPIDDLLKNDDLIQAVNRLSPKLKAPVVLKYNFDYSYEAIAKTLGIPVGTVKSRISNAVKSIEKELERYGQG
ncbi:MAG: hypothetical protein K0R50_1454 [Eubacterium sp.]|nr:hypothetical protein [Eubacterium sp.]